MQDLVERWTGKEGERSMEMDARQRGVRSKTDCAPWRLPEINADYLQRRFEPTDEVEA